MASTFKPLAGVLCLAFVLLQLLNLVEASHFAYGTFSWFKVPDSVGRTFTITSEMAFRRSYTSSFKQTTVGGSLTHGTLYVRSSTGSNIKSYSNKMTIMAVYAQDDWFTGRAVFNHTFSSHGRYQLYYSLCCRLSSLKDRNNDDQTYMYGYIDTTIERSPESTGFPREYLAVNYPAMFVVPGLSNIGRSLTFSFATTSQSGLTQPKPQNPTQVLNSQTGTVTWTPTVKGLYTVQYRISDGGNDVPLDMLFDVSEPCSNPRNCITYPEFVPATPVKEVFYRGVQRSVPIVAKDMNSGATVTIETTVMNEGTFVPVTIGATSTYNFIWSPSIDSNSFTVCFKAKNSHGYFSLGNYCKLMEIGRASIIYVTGIIRDFVRADPGFNVGDGGVVVSNTLSAELKPVFSSSSGVSISKATFDSWWRTDDLRNHQLAYSTTLSNGTSPNGNIFTFLNDKYYPIDNILLGNNGDSNNRFFTYEIHTYLTYRGGEIFDLGSSDDLWVFINRKLPNSWTLGGTHSFRTMRLDMDAIAQQHNPPLSIGSTYQVDIFYAHRSGSTTRTSALRLELSNAVLCNAIQSGTEVFDFDFTKGAVASSKFRLLGTASQLSSGLQLVSSSVASASGAVWFAQNGVPIVASVLHGFLCEFTFTASSSTGAEGFAFVLQRAGADARGAEGGNLGYGTMPNSVAFEFDMHSDTASYSDPAYQHVSIHTRYQLTNDPSEAYSIGVSNNDPPLTMANNTAHSVRVQYIPANVEEGSTSTVQLGWLYVYIGNVLAPVAVAQVDGVKLARIFEGGNAYIGFTASNGDTRKATINISKWKLTIVPTSAAATALVALPTTVRAGATGSVIVQAKDSCSNKVLVGGEARLLTATTALSSGALSTNPTVSVTDRGDGTYLLSYTPTYAGQMVLNVLFDGQPILNSPFRYTVQPALTVAANSPWYYSPSVAVSASNGPASINQGLFVVVVRDSDGSVTKKQFDFVNSSPNSNGFPDGGTAAFTDRKSVV